MNGIAAENMVVRDFRPPDYPGVAALWKASGISNPERDDSGDDIAQTLTNGGKLILIEDSVTGDVIGTSWITNDGRRLYLHHFAIHPDWQKKGLSWILLEHSLSFAKMKKMQIKLEVHHENTIAKQLYQKAGFRYLGDYDVYIIREPENINSHQHNQQQIIS